MRFTVKRLTLRHTQLNHKVLHEQEPQHSSFITTNPSLFWILIYGPKDLHTLRIQPSSFLQAFELQYTIRVAWYITLRSFSLLSLSHSYYNPLYPHSTVQYDLFQPSSRASVEAYHRSFLACTVLYCTIALIKNLNCWTLAMLGLGEKSEWLQSKIHLILFFWKKKTIKLGRIRGRGEREVRRMKSDPRCMKCQRFWFWWSTSSI